MRRRARTAAVLLAILLASTGCGAPLGAPAADDPGAGGNATLSPAPVPEAAGAGSAEALAPGVTADGVVDPVRLGTAHERALADVSYTARRNVTRRDPDGAVHRITRLLVHVSGDDGRFHYQLALRRGNRLEIDRYGDGDRIYERERSSNGTSYALVTGPDGRPLAAADASYGDPTNRRGIVDLVARLQFEVTSAVERDGATHYRLATAEPRALPPARNITAHLLVRDDGLVREYDVTYRIDRERSTVVRLEGAFTDVGATTVLEPDWYRTAINETEGPVADRLVAGQVVDAD